MSVFRKIIRKVYRRMYDLCNKIYIATVKEFGEYIKFKQSFKEYYISKDVITDLSECVYRKTYYNDRNKTLVSLCKRQDMEAIEKWYEEIDGDKVYFDEYFENRMSMRIIAKHISRNLSKGSMILDVACGHGAIDRVLSKRGYKVTGIDLNHNRIDSIKSYIYKAECVKLEDIEENLKYDVIVSLEMLEHVTDIFKTLKKIYSLLKGGGLLYVSVPNERMIDDEQHVRFFNSDSMIRLLQESGFSVINVTTLPYLNYEKDNDLVCVATK